MSDTDTADTIFAQASALGKAGVSVFRISGPRAVEGIGALCPIPEPGGRGLRVLRNLAGEPIDEALVLHFPQRASFTGEPVLELQTHGGGAVREAILACLGRLPGFRLAYPGEFTRRALENGRMDLAQAEGLADLIDAETEAQREQALSLMQGGLSVRAAAWRSDLVHALALIEATIDFVDEDVPVDVTPEVLERLRRVREEIETEISGSHAAERLRVGFEVAILGRPNVGKSTLLNAIAGRDVAITSDIAGTTRDVVEVRCDLGGIPVTFLDTAGIRMSGDKIEAMGVERAQRRAIESDLRIFLLTSDQEFDGLGVACLEHDLKVGAKADDLQTDFAVQVSGATGAGVAGLLDRVQQRLSDRLAIGSSASRLRHRLGMEKAVEGLASSEAMLLLGDLDDELVSAEIQDSVRALDSIVGRVDVENILDVVFAEFCMGK